MEANLLIADPNKAAWTKVSEALVGEGTSVYFAGSAEKTVKLLAERTFFLVLLELELPGGGGVALLRRIKRFYPDLSVALVSSQKSFESAVEAVGAGAEDYLFKPVQQENFLTLVERSYNQHCYQEHKKQIISKMEDDLEQLRDYYGFDQAAVYQRHKISLAHGVTVDINMSALVAGENKTQLSSRELSLLVTFLKHHGKVLSPKKIFRQIYNKEPNREDPGEIARTMVHRLRKKLSTVLPNLPLIQNNRGEGYMINSNPVDTASEEDGER